MPDIGDKLRALREDRRLSRKAFGDLVGISEAKVQALEVGKQRVDHEALANIASKLSIDANWLLGLDQCSLRPANVDNALKNFVPVPMLDLAASAGPGASHDHEVHRAFFSVDMSWLSQRGLSPSGLSVIAVRGDSMEPALEDGEMIMIDANQTQPRDSGVYVVRFSDELFVKRVQKLPGNRVQLLSQNPAYPPIIADPADAKEISIIGRVVASMRAW